MTTQSTPIIIHADRILDGRGNVIQGGSVVVSGDKISKVDKTAAGARDLRPQGLHAPSRA